MECGTLKENEAVCGEVTEETDVSPFSSWIGVLMLHALTILLCDDYLSDCMCKNSLKISISVLLYAETTAIVTQ